ncbi:hypothetical protein SERLA73DRAFT_153734 [Serpula lacrymans var. lacrymans S7.3]|uniref:Uncharacterized protein n=1 Tax=Serpula lacrymans var. lacrymans (strain S7.3) TaxID=936435 RepID=F8Q276_SERL3|nr:hypothetical protein SERLA73DRAFT_153734 [Serpula lacrymans var. lacrymans S7.3]
MAKFITQTQLYVFQKNNPSFPTSKFTLLITLCQAWHNCTFNFFKTTSNHSKTKGKYLKLPIRLYMIVQPAYTNPSRTDRQQSATNNHRGEGANGLDLISHHRGESSQPKKTFYLKKPQSLDPKRAMNFNKHAVQDYFEKQRQINKIFNGIPPEHDWNMDEKGIQMEGGQKNSGSKFYFDRTKKDTYQVSSNNFELVTVIECILAAGICMKPSFILKDRPFPDVQDLEGIGRYTVTTKS